jgi:hypothetical protein
MCMKQMIDVVASLRICLCFTTSAQEYDITTLNAHKSCQMAVCKAMDQLFTH